MREMPLFTIEEIEEVFTEWAKNCGANEDVLAGLWHEFGVRLMVLGVKKTTDQPAERP